MGYDTRSIALIVQFNSSFYRIKIYEFLHFNGFCHLQDFFQKTSYSISPIPHLNSYLTRWPPPARSRVLRSVPSAPSLPCDSAPLAPGPPLAPTGGSLVVTPYIRISVGLAGERFEDDKCNGKTGRISRLKKKRIPKWRIIINIGC